VADGDVVRHRVPAERHEERLVREERGPVALPRQRRQFGLLLPGHALFAIRLEEGREAHRPGEAASASLAQLKPLFVAEDLDVLDRRVTREVEDLRFRAARADADARAGAVFVDAGGVGALLLGH
jgi:hypothetical protein